MDDTLKRFETQSMKLASLFASLPSSEIDELYEEVAFDQSRIEENMRTLALKASKQFIDQNQSIPSHTLDVMAIGEQLMVDDLSPAHVDNHEAPSPFLEYANREQHKTYEQYANWNRNQENSMACSRYHSQYVYCASAYALAAEVDRPTKYSLAPQASVVLASHGGHGASRVPGQKVDGLISYREAYCEVGGSYDDCHGIYTTHAWSVVEGLNIADMLTADRVVSRMAVYHPADDSGEASYDITGSHFENLRIAGHKIEVKLATHVFHDHDTYQKVAKAHQTGASDDWLQGAGLLSMSDKQLRELEDKYCALTGMSRMVEEWKKKEGRPEQRGGYRFSVANHLDLKKQIGPTELEGYGSIICIPKFGVIRLGEMIVHKHSRTLSMFCVQMCSSGHGNASGGSCSAGDEAGG